jgi:CheY-like chemotaxis protein
MEQTNKRQFVVVDDDSVNNYLTAHILRRQKPDATIDCFTNAEECLTHLRKQTDQIPSVHKTLLFVDINMPQTSGWDVLDLLKEFPEDLQKQWRIFLFTSSIATEDKVRADQHPMVAGLLTKPLNSLDLEALLSDN